MPHPLLSHLMGRLLLLFSPRVPSERIPVYAPMSSSAMRLSIARKVEAALSLIEDHDPACYARLKRDLAAIVLWPAAPFAGALNSATRICLLSRSMVEEDRAGLATAVVLVHEAMHARLLRMRARKDARRLRQIERICKRAELQFLLSIPDFTDRDTAIRRAEAEIDLLRDDA